MYINCLGLKVAESKSKLIFTIEPLTAEADTNISRFLKFKFHVYDLEVMLIH